MGIHYGSQSLVTCRRISNFLLTDDENMFTSDSWAFFKEIYESGDNQIPLNHIRKNKPHLSLNDITCYPNDDPQNPLLEKVSFSVTGNQLVVLTGPTGSGKFSVLNVITKEVQISSGTILHDGCIAHVSQSPWMFSGTIRENIVFGKPFRDKKYHDVIKACALKQDFDALPNGNLTQIGERGISLSGGQKARINLARAVYYDADVFLLDDPLCSLDSKVSEQIFQHCICGILKGRLRVLVTHNPRFLERADCVIVIRNGQVDAIGKYDKLLSSNEYLRNLPETDKEKEGHMKKDSTICLLSPGKF